MIYLAQQWAEGSQLTILSILLGIVLLTPSLIAFKKGKENLAVYIIFSLFLAGFGVMTIISGINGKLSIVIPAAILELICGIFLLVFIFKWKDE